MTAREFSAIGKTRFTLKSGEAELDSIECFPDEFVTRVFTWASEHPEKAKTGFEVYGSSVHMGTVSVDSGRWAWRRA